MDANSPSLKARVLVCIALENLKGNTLLPKTLGETEPTEACSNNEYVHVDEYVRFRGGLERFDVFVWIPSFPESKRLYIQ